MTFETTLTRTTYIKINFLLLSRRWNFYLAFVLLLAAAALWAPPGQIWLYILAALFLVLALYAILIIRHALSSKNRNFYLPGRYTFRDDGVSLNSPVGDEELKWSAFINWKRVGGYYLIYVSRANFMTVPLAVIPPDDLAAFETLLREKIG